MKQCCQQEAVRSLGKHRDVAICDGCGWLLLAYAEVEDYERTLEELADWPHATGAVLDLLVIAKQRS